MDDKRTERISLFEGFGQPSGKKQHVLLADSGIEAGGKTAGSGNVYQFPIGLCRKVHLTMRGKQLQRRDTDYRRIGKEASGKGSHTQAGTFVHGKLTDNGIHVSAVIHHGVNAQANVPQSNMRSIETFRRSYGGTVGRIQTAGIIVDGRTGKEEFLPAIKLMLQVGSSIGNLGIPHMGCHTHGVKRHLQANRHILQFQFMEGHFPIHRGSGSIFRSIGSIGKQHLHMGIAQFNSIEDRVFLSEVYAVAFKKEMPEYTFYPHPLYQIGGIDSNLFQGNVVHLHFPLQQRPRLHTYIQAFQVQQGIGMLHTGSAVNRLYHKHATDQQIQRET